MRTLLASVLVALLSTPTFGCSTQKESKGDSAVETPAEGETTDTEDELPPAAKAEKFGADIDPNTEVVALADILKDPEAYKNKNVTTTGTVRQVCQKRGCWAEIRPEDARESETMRVTFLGYAFFLPKDSRGASVKIEGKVSIQLLSPEQVAELEEEGGTVGTVREDGSAIATQFIASGVEMTGRKK